MITEHNEGTVEPLRLTETAQQIAEESPTHQARVQAEEMNRPSAGEFGELLGDQIGRASCRERV